MRSDRRESDAHETWIDEEEDPKPADRVWGNMLQGAGGSARVVM